MWAVREGASLPKGRPEGTPDRSNPQALKDQPKERRLPQPPSPKGRPEGTPGRFNPRA